MIGVIILTVSVIIMGAILLLDLFSFWNDRTGIGNFAVGTVIILTLAWFITGLYQLWK